MSQVSPQSQVRRYWLQLHPDIARPIGGVKQMHRLAEALSALGRQATVVQDAATFHPGWFESRVSTMGLDQWQAQQLDPFQDVLLFPETFLPQIRRYPSDLPKMIFNQNGAYSFGPRSGKQSLKPGKVLRLYQRNVAHVLCISEHDELLLRDGFGLGPQRVTRLVNGIETALFHPAGVKKRRIAYMPRKNSQDAAIVAELLRQQPWLSSWELMPIHGLAQVAVAEILRSSLVFLAFGHPEGFGLPLAEALASGCYLIGYSGLGGRELFTLAARHGAGEEVAFGDWFGFVQAMAQFNERLDADQVATLQGLLTASKTVRAHYGGMAMQRSLEVALPHLERSLSQPC